MLPNNHESDILFFAVTCYHLHNLLLLQQRPPPQRIEVQILGNFSKEIVDHLDLDDVKPGHMWIPISIDRFEQDTEVSLSNRCTPGNSGMFYQ